MSDPGRKDFGTKIMETLTPQAMKSDSQKANEHAIDTTDMLAQETQPDSSKSTSQQVADKMGGTNDSAAHCSSGEGFGEKIKHALHMEKPQSSTTDTTHTLGSTTTAHHGDYGTSHTTTDTAHMPGSAGFGHTNATHLPGFPANGHTKIIHHPDTAAAYTKDTRIPGTAANAGTAIVPGRAAANTNNSHISGTGI